ncbi:MAG: hypothetical protein WCH11_01460 [Bdellovibrio sp.]
MLKTFSVFQLIGLFFLVASNISCQVDTTKDVLQKSKDRDRELSKTLTSDYEIVAGSYETHPESPAAYWMHFEILVLKDLKLQPSLGGSISFIDKALLRPNESPLVSNPKELLQVNIWQGVYDPPSGQMILQLAPLNDSALAVTINCKMSDTSRIPCIWKPASRVSPFEFVLRKL